VTTLYVLRHGVAEEALPGGDDRARRLTARGRAKMQKAAAGLRALGVRPDVILTSPLPRAAETAAIVASVCGRDAGPQELPQLAPGTAPPEVVRALRPFARREHVMLVGHEPQLSELVAALLTGGMETIALDLRKGGCVAVELARLHPPAGAMLRWMLTPKQLRRIS
jgi:phosphohistidine phosphatase